MRNDRKNAPRDILNRSLGLHANPSSEEVQSVVDRIWEGLKSSDHAGTAPVGLSVKTTAPTPRRRLVFAAVLVATLAIGLYAGHLRGLLPVAHPKQQTNVPQVGPVVQSPLSSVSPTPVPESGTIGAAVGGSRQPVVIAGGRQPSRSAAEEVTLLQSTDAGARRLEFAATSVRKAEKVQVITPIRCRGVDGELVPVFPIDNPEPTPQGRCTGSYVNLTNLIGTAYASSTSLPRVIGVPNSLVMDDSGQPRAYQFQATAEDPGGVTKAELQQMLRNVLMDRFKARVRRETREMDGFAMTVARSGIKFKETSSEAQKPGITFVPGVDRESIRQFGGLMPLLIKGNYRMSAIRQMLESTLLRIPVADKTGLPGVYDITLNLHEVRGPLVQGARGGAGGPQAPEFSPSIPKAFEDQLGLHLEPAKVRVEFVIVEHIEEPSEN